MAFLGGGKPGLGRYLHLPDVGPKLRPQLGSGPRSAFSRERLSLLARPVVAAGEEVPVLNGAVQQCGD